MESWEASPAVGVEPVHRPVLTGTVTLQSSLELWRYVGPMARTYGFRVFIVEAYPNRKAGNEALNAAHDSALRQELALLLERLQRTGTVRIFPPTRSDGSESGKPVRTATVNVVEDVRSHVVHVGISIGETGSHSKATKPNKKAKNLEDWSPEAEHAVTLVFPSERESRFFLVTQTIHRRDPLLRLIKLLRDESTKRRAELQEVDKSKRDAARSKGTRAAAAPKRTRLMFDHKQASDDAYLDEILAGADSASVVFKSKRMDAKGGKEYVERILQIKLRDHNILDVGRTLGRRWTQRWRNGVTTTAGQAVSEVADLLEDQDLIDDGEHVRYETAAISVRNKAEAATTIAADTLKDAFTYPVSDIKPDPHTYYQEVFPRLAKIAAQEGIEIEEIDPHEVARCLIGSTPDQS